MKSRGKSIFKSNTIFLLKQHHTLLRYLFNRPLADYNFQSCVALTNPGTFVTSVIPSLINSHTTQGSRQSHVHTHVLQGFVICRQLHKLYNHTRNRYSTDPSAYHFFNLTCQMPVYKIFQQTHYQIKKTGKAMCLYKPIVALSFQPDFVPSTLLFLALKLKLLGLLYWGLHCWILRY